MEEARQALGDGRFPDAVKLCKQLLKHDRRNYDGFVVLGLALVRSSQHLDQAEMSLKKAISLDPSALPAYQAMVELRESMGSSPDLLAESIQAALDVARARNQSALAADLMRKLARTFSAGHKHDQAKAAWGQVLDMEVSREQRVEALSGIVDAHIAAGKGAKECEATGEEETQAMVSHLEELVSMLPYVEIYRELLLALLACKARRGEQTKKDLLKHSREMLSTCPSTMAADVLVAMAEEDDAEELFEDFETGEASFRVWIGKHVAHLYPGRGITLASSKCKTSRKMLAEWDVSCDENSISGCRMLAKELVSEGLFEKASERVGKGLASIALKRRSYGLVLKAAELDLRLVLGGLLLLKQNHDEAARVFMNVSEEAKSLPEQRSRIIIGEAFQGLVKLSLAMKERDVAKSRLDQILRQDPKDHWALSERGWLAFETSSFNQAKADLENAVSACQESAIYHYRLGRVYWETEDMKEKAAHEFVESAKLDPSRADTFIYLGHYYRELAKDLRRAVRCYQKAVALDAENEATGEMLCDILDHGGQFSMEKNICEEASKKSPRAFWAWRRLGFIQVAERKWSEAISSTQYGLRGYPTDSRLWEALALSYKRLGMLTAASKAFGRAFDLDNSSLFAALEMGAIDLALSAFSKATRAYREALRISPGELIAIHGLVSSLLGQARECFTQGAFWWCATILKEAIDLAIGSRSMYGHLLMYAQSLPFESADPQRSWQEAVDSWYSERVDAANNAVHAYRRAIHLLPSEGSLYRDLATAMEYMLNLKKPSRPSQTRWFETEIIVCCGLQHDGSNADMWVSLALVTQHKGLRQHALIQALRLDANHAIAWAYLGQLYLSLGEQVLAQQSFDRARSADPTLSLPWAGMALIHYNLSQRTASKDQALEAFASCSCAVQLSCAPNVHLGVGQLAAQTQNLGLPQVNLALQHASQRQPLQAAAHNLRGLSCESRKDYMPAVVAYRNSRSAATKALLSSELQTLITANLARTLCKAGNAKDAVLEYNKLRDSASLDDLDDIRSYAVALRDSGQGAQAEVLIKKALTARTPHDSRAQFAAMLVLLSKLTYFNQGPVPGFDVLWSAPDILFLDEELCLTALSLALSTCRTDRISAAISRCRYLFTSKYAADAYVLIASMNQAEVIPDLKRALHCYPTSGILRAKLGEIILSHGSHDHGSTSKLVERLCSMSSLISDDRLTQKLSSLVLVDATVACGQYGTEILLQLQRLVHREPWNMKARYCLILVLLGGARRQGFPRHLCHTILRISTTTLYHLPSSSDRQAAYMRMQIELCVSESELRLGNYTCALDRAVASLNAIKGFSDLNAAPAYLQLARCYRLLNDLSHLVKGAVAGWQQQTDVKRDNALWHLSLLELQLCCGVIKEEDSVLLRLRHLLQQSKQGWLALLEVMLARFYYQRGEPELSEDAAANALLWWPNNPVLCLFHGAVSLELAKSGKGASYASKAVSSLGKAVRDKGRELPTAYALLAQAESSGSKDGSNRAGVVKKWAKHLRAAFLAWPTTEHPVPAEMFFLMALLSKQQVGGEQGERCPEDDRTWWSWLQAAVHLNPTCPKYWTLLKQIK
ncbi:tetratricopeptide repeat protein SKI3 [Selaginella moellendorffii]|uniref:tetratricopeptide repeat protein SKI3 n=1 Tax=Selaginella moellendorffii TaxID=88036 RepID=UPI000D1CD104|nr:tetratricopeptide repeat protein SKI3 [Selaginella moellendorffii]|eukprot:XP_024542904.1 tetratricopeptide repeat protein SKI3 [Selaginella moellendorffii]